MNSQRSNVIVIVLVVLSTLGTVFALFFGEKFSTYESYRNDVYSYSALGHRGFHEVLESNFDNVIVAQDALQQRDFLLIIEPQVLNQEDEFQELLGRCTRCVLVLPKRTGFPDEDGHHIAKYKLIDRYTIDGILDQYFINLSNLKVTRIKEVSRDINTYNLPLPKIAGSVQVVQGVDPERIIFGNKDGALIFSETIDGSSKIVISDPDILANHGIDEAENYTFLLGFLNAELGSDPMNLTIDETMHGYRRAPSLLRLLTSFPLSIFTIQLLFILLFVTWRGLIVFGRPNLKGQPIELGAKTLIDNTAALFSPNHAVYLGLQYTKAAMMDVADSLNASRQLTQKELIVWLDEQTESRGFSFRISAELNRLEEFELELERWKPKDIVAVAQQVDQWRNRMKKE